MQQRQQIFLQVISTNPSDSTTIQSYGGNRVELVSALQIGGVTPSSTIVRKSLQVVSIPTNVIVRHHNNGFIYTHKQKSLLLEDIIELRDRYQVHGVVVGSLEQHGTELLADTAFMREVAKECGGKTKITFHKASDYTTNLSETIKTLSQIGVNEVLTQGGQDYILSQSSCSAIKQIDTNLRQKMILPGGGINHSNVRQVIDQWKVQRIHIGTCVRQQKYGAILKESLIELRKILQIA